MVPFHVIIGVRKSYMSKRNQVYILKEAPVTKALIHLSIPSITTSLVMTLHNLIDTIFISQLQDNAMIAATTVALPIMVLIQAIGDGIGAGSGSYVGRLLGAQDEHKIEDTVSTAMLLTLILSIFTLILSLTGIKQIVLLFTDDLNVANYAFLYMRVLMIGATFSIVKQVCSYLLRNSGDVSFPMKTVLLEIVVNTILNPILMFDFGFGLSIQGAALATIIAQGLSALLLLNRLLTHNTSIKWRFGNFRFNLDSFKEICNVGFPVFLRNGLPSLSYGLYAKSAGLFSTDFVAAAGIARRGQHLANFVIIGMSHGYQPFASYNYGAKNKKRLLEAMYKSFLFTTVYGIIMAIIFFTVPNLIISIITQDPSLILIGKDIVKAYAISMPILGIYQVLAGSFQACGKGKLSFWTSILRQGIIYCPMVIILPRLFGEVGFTLVQPICDWISMIIVCFFAKELIKEINQM